MTSEKFAAGDWIDRLALALRSLAEAQESYLPEYYGRSRRLQIVFGEQVGPPPAFPLADVPAASISWPATAMSGVKGSTMRPCARCWTPFGLFCGRIPRWSGSQVLSSARTNSGWKSSNPAL